MSRPFIDLIRDQIVLEADNYFTDNFDHDAFGEHPSLKRRVIDFGKRLLYGGPQLRFVASHDMLFRNVFLGAMRGLEPYVDRLGAFHERLADQPSKDLLLKLVAFRALGHVKVKLPLSTPDYWSGLERFEGLRDENDAITLDYKPWTLYRHDLASEGHDISLYLNSKGVYTTFGLHHYRYQTDDVSIAASDGNVALDLGGCYGDTALYFSEQVGPGGKVFTFEFSPQNLRILGKNLDLNPKLRERIHVVERPLWSHSDAAVYFRDHGAGSRVEFEQFDGFDGSSTTISLDDFVASNDIDAVDFLKTDIEGAEPHAIAGATETLRRFRPKLAISIYHNMGDFVGLVEQIDDLALGYEFFLGHATIYSSETVLFGIASGR